MKHMYTAPPPRGSRRARAVGGPEVSSEQLDLWGVGFTHRLQSSSFLGLPYRILNINHKKELLWSLWVVLSQLSGCVQLRTNQSPCVPHPVRTFSIGLGCGSDPSSISVRLGG